MPKRQMRSKEKPKIKSRIFSFLKALAVIAIAFLFLFLLVRIIGYSGGLGKSKKTISYQGCSASYCEYLIHPKCNPMIMPCVPSSNGFNQERALRRVVQCLCESRPDDKSIIEFVHENSLVLWCRRRSCSREVLDKADGVKKTRIISVECDRDSCFEDLKNYGLSNIEAGIASNEADFYCLTFQPYIFN